MVKILMYTYVYVKLKLSLPLQAQRGYSVHQSIKRVKDTSHGKRKQLKKLTAKLTQV